MSDGTGQTAQQEFEQLRLENARLRELMQQAKRVRDLYEKALKKIKHVETSLYETNSILQAMHHCGQALLRSSDERLWLQDVCRIIADGTDYKLAWIGYLDGDGQRIRVVAEAGIEGPPADDGWFCLMKPEGEVCPAVNAMQSGRIQLIKDIGGQPDCTPWIKEAIERGFIASILLPLGRNGKHDGVLCLYAKSSNVFDQHRVKLLAQLAGEISFGISFLREKQQREKAEQSLSENEQRLRLAFAAAKQAWFDLDVRSGEALLSPEYAPLFGYGPEEPEKSLQHWKGDLHPEDREAALSALDECLATGGPTTLEYRRRTKSGEWKWVLSVGKVIEWDDEHKPLRLIGIHMDISNRKGMESALLESEEQYRLLFENSGEAILLANPDGRIYSANPAACRMFGRSEKELIKVGRAGILDGGDPAVQLAMAERKERGSFHGELKMLRGDGSYFPVELSSVRFRDSRGNQRTSLMIRDITVRKRHEILLQARLRLVNTGSDVDYHALMRETLDIAEEVTDSKIGFFHFVDDDQGTISLQAWSTNTIENMCTAEAAGMNYKLNEAGVWADAIRKKAPVIHNDYPHLDDRQGMPEGHAVVEREVCVPVVRDDKVVAAIGVGNKSCDYVEEDIEVLYQLVNFAWEVIEARKADMAMRESELRYRALFQSAADYALVLEAMDGNDFPIITDANDAALAKHGYSREEMIGKPISLIDREMKAEQSAEVMRQLMAGSPIHFEVEHTCKDGSTFLVESSASLVGSAKGRVQFFAVERDITERKQAEDEVQRARGELLEAQRIAHLGSWQVDNASKRVIWSEELFRMWGLDPNEPVPVYTEHHKLFTAESWERLDTALRHTQESGAPYELELEFVRPDGVHGWMLARGELHRDASGAVIGVHGVAMDITGRKKSEQILRQRLDELERFTKAAVRREFRIKELKEQIASLKDLQADKQP